MKIKATRQTHNDPLSKTVSPFKISSIILSGKLISTMRYWEWLLPILMMQQKINSFSQIFIPSISSTPLMNLISKKRLSFRLILKWARSLRTWKKLTRPSKTKSRDGQLNSLKLPDFHKLYFHKTKSSERPFVQKINNFWNLSNLYQIPKIKTSHKWKKTLKS